MPTRCWFRMWWSPPTDWLAAKARSSVGVVIVDTHIHVVAEDKERYPLNPTGNAPSGAWYEDDPCSAERLLSLMDESGVDFAVLVQGISAYQWDNRYAADSARKYPERFTSVGCTNLGAENAVDEVRHLLIDEAMRGLRFAGGLPLSGGDTGRSYPPEVWQLAEELRVPAVMTLMANGIPRLLETLAQAPRVPIAIDHCAFVEPGKEHWDEFLTLSELPHVALKVSTNALMTASKVGVEPADFVEELAGRFGADRLMWGSDYSQTHHAPYPELVAFGRRATAKLSAEQRASFDGETALRYWPELAP